MAWGVDHAARPQHLDRPAVGVRAALLHRDRRLVGAVPLVAADDVLVDVDSGEAHARIVACGSNSLINKGFFGAGEL